MHKKRFGMIGGSGEREKGGVESKRWGEWRVRDWGS